MEKKIYQENPDGSRTTIIEKKGFILRDGLIAVAAGATGIFMGGVSVPILNETVTKAIPTASKVVKKGVVYVGSFVIGEIVEHSVSRSLNDVCEAADDFTYDIMNNKLVRNMMKDSKESSEKTEETKKK